MQVCFKLESKSNETRGDLSEVLCQLR